MTKQKGKKVNKSEKAPPVEPNIVIPNGVESAVNESISKVESAAPAIDTPKVSEEINAPIAVSTVKPVETVPSTPSPKVPATAPTTAQSVGLKLPMERSPMVPVTPETANASYSDLYSNIIEDSGVPKSFSTNPLQNSVGRAYSLDKVYAAEGISPLRNAPEDELRNPMLNPRTPAADTKVGAPVTVTPEVSPVVPSSKETSPTEKVVVSFATGSHKSIPIYINQNASLKSTRSFTSTTSVKEEKTITLVTSSSSSVVVQQETVKHRGGPSDSALGEPSPLSTSSSAAAAAGVESKVYHLESSSLVFDDIASEITESSAVTSSSTAAAEETDQPYVAPKASYREQLLPSIEEEDQQGPQVYSLVDQFKDTVLSLLGFKIDCAAADMTLAHRACALLLDALLFFPLMWLSFYVWLFQLIWRVVTIAATLAWDTTAFVVSAPFCLVRSIYQSVTNAVVAVLVAVLRFVPGGSKIALQISPHALRG